MLHYNEVLNGFEGSDDLVDDDIQNIDDLFADEDEVEVDPDTLEPDDEEDE